MGSKSLENPRCQTLPKQHIFFFFKEMHCCFLTPDGQDILGVVCMIFWTFAVYLRFRCPDRKGLKHWLSFNKAVQNIALYTYKSLLCLIESCHVPKEPKERWSSCPWSGNSGSNLWSKFYTWFDGGDRFLRHMFIHTHMHTHAHTETWRDFLRRKRIFESTLQILGRGGRRLRRYFFRNDSSWGKM